VRNPFSFQRIAVIGSTGSGKTTLAATLAARLHIPHIELDALYWQPDWAEADWDEMRARVDELTRLPAWVTDGNYSFLRDLIWERAEVVLWLDFPLATCLWQLWRRTWRRIFSREPLWGTNVEKFWPQFFSRDSIFYWALRTFAERRRRYATLFASGAFPHLALYRFKSRGEVERWMRTGEWPPDCPTIPVQSSENGGIKRGGVRQLAARRPGAGPRREAQREPSCVHAGNGKETSRARSPSADSCFLLLPPFGSSSPHREHKPRKEKSQP